MPWETESSPCVPPSLKTEEETLLCPLIHPSERQISSYAIQLQERRVYTGTANGNDKGQHEVLRLIHRAKLSPLF